MLSFAVLIGSFKLFKNDALIPKDKFFCSLDHEISCTNLMLDTYFSFVCFWHVRIWYWFAYNTLSIKNYILESDLLAFKFFLEETDFSV